jgi:hypothetical protein
MLKSVRIEGSEVVIQSGAAVTRLSFDDVIVAARVLREHLVKLMPPELPSIEITSAGWHRPRLEGDIPVPPARDGQLLGTDGKWRDPKPGQEPRDTTDWEPLWNPDR